MKKYVVLVLLVLGLTGCQGGLDLTGGDPRAQEALESARTGGNKSEVESTEVDQFETAATSEPDTAEGNTAEGTESVQLTFEQQAAEAGVHTDNTFVFYLDAQSLEDGEEPTYNGEVLSRVPTGLEESDSYHSRGRTVFFCAGSEVEGQSNSTVVYINYTERQQGPVMVVSGECIVMSGSISEIIQDAVMMSSYIARDKQLKSVPVYIRTYAQ